MFRNLSVTSNKIRSIVNSYSLVSTTSYSNSLSIFIIFVNVRWFVCLEVIKTYKILLWNSSFYKQNNFLLLLKVIGIFLLNSILYLIIRRKIMKIRSENKVKCTLSIVGMDLTAFKRLCREQRTTPSIVVGQLIHEYLLKEGEKTC